jgi:hypothetical protein
MLHMFTLAFVVLKLMGYISWSWWLVVAPSLVGIAVILLALIVTAWITYRYG